MPTPSNDQEDIFNIRQRLMGKVYDRDFKEDYPALHKRIVQVLKDEPGDKRIYLELRQFANAPWTYGSNPPPQGKGEDAPLAIVPGGFTLSGRRFRLSGRPWHMLRILLESRHQAAKVDDLRNRMGINDEPRDMPEQIVRDTACKLRKALRKAAKVIGCAIDDPLPSIGRGQDLCYSLDLKNLVS
jgi:hypothetical protein